MAELQASTFQEKEKEFNIMKEDMEEMSKGKGALEKEFEKINKKHMEKENILISSIEKQKEE